MIFTSPDQAIRTEQSKFYAHTNTWPNGYPYVQGATKAVERGDMKEAALHLSSLARLNAELDRLSNASPSIYKHYVEKWMELVRSSPNVTAKIAPAFRGWRVEVLTAAELVAHGARVEIGDANPRVQQRMPDLRVHAGVADLAVECTSVEPSNGSDLAKAVRRKAWNKAHGEKGLRDYVGPNALLVVDITNVVSRWTARARDEENVDLEVFQRGLIHALDRRRSRHGTDWGAIMLHFVGIYAERAHEGLRELDLDRPTWAISTRGSGVVVTTAAEPLEFVNRSFFSSVNHRPSAALRSQMDRAFPMASGRWTATLEGVPPTLIY